MIIFKTIFPNGKIYIAQTTRANHKNYFGSGIVVRIEIKKVGKQNLKKEILKRCSSKKQLDAWEKIYIKKFDARNPEIGYNISVGGASGMTNRNHSFDSKIKISKSRKGLYAGKRNPMFGKEHSEESKERNRQSHLGKTASIETKNKMKKSSTKRWKNPLERVEQSLRLKGKIVFSEERKDKMRKLILERYKSGWINPMTNRKHKRESIDKMKKNHNISNSL